MYDQVYEEHFVLQFQHLNQVQALQKHQSNDNLRVNERKRKKNSKWEESSKKHIEENRFTLPPL
jgi:hypothetical protein